MGLRSVVRGKTKRTTVASDHDQRPLEFVKRVFRAERPNLLWVDDFTDVATWTGFFYIALVIDVFSRMVVGWRAARSMSAERTLDAVEFAMLEWVDWFNNRRLLEPIGPIPPAEFEESYYKGQEVLAFGVGLT